MPGMGRCWVGAGLMGCKCKRLPKFVVHRQSLEDYFPSTTETTGQAAATSWGLLHTQAWDKTPGTQFMAQGQEDLTI